MRQRPGEIRALWQRIATSTALVAPLSWAAGRFIAGPIPVTVVTGWIGGALGIRPQKVVFGPLLGAAIGLGLASLRRQVPAAAVASATMVSSRVSSALLFRDPQVSLLAERVRAEDLPFVMPLEARSHYVGTGYIKDLAKVLGGSYVVDARRGHRRFARRAGRPRLRRLRSIRRSASFLPHTSQARS